MPSTQVSFQVAALSTHEGPKVRLVLEAVSESGYRHLQSTFEMTPQITRDLIQQLQVVLEKLD